MSKRDRYEDAQYEDGDEGTVSDLIRHEDPVNNINTVRQTKRKPSHREEKVKTLRDHRRGR